MNRNRAKFLFSVAMPLGLGTLIVLAFLFSGGFVQAGEVEATATPNDPILAAISRDMDQMDTILKEEGLTDNQKAKYRAKKKNLEQKATERADYLAHKDEAWIQKQTAIVHMTLTISAFNAQQTPMPTTSGELHTEIGNPWHKHADFSSAWVVHTTDTFMIYFAGKLITDPDQGLLYIDNRNDRTVQIVYTPKKDGGLKVKGAENNTITLESKKGKQYYFNMETKKFVDERGNPLPEATETPLPAYPAP